MGLYEKHITSFDDIQSAFDYQPKMPSEQPEEKTKKADESYWTSVHAELPWTMHFVENEEVMFPVTTFENKKKNKSNMWGRAHIMKLRGLRKTANLIKGAE